MTSRDCGEEERRFCPFVLAEEDRDGAPRRVGGLPQRQISRAQCSPLMARSQLACMNAAPRMRCRACLETVSM
jgi:hypothetical protein